MRRRDFIAVLSAGAVLPMVARAQQPTRVYRVGFVSSIGTPYLYPLDDPRSGVVRPFAAGLRDLGYVDGQNLLLMRRGTNGELGRGGDVASALIREGAEIIVVTTTTLAKEMSVVTNTIPIVMAASIDPVSMGVAESLAKPGKNITGFSSQSGPEISAKRLQLLKDTVPGTSRVALFATGEEWGTPNVAALRHAAKELALDLFHAEYMQNDYAGAFALMTQKRPHGIIVSPQPTNPTPILLFAQEHKIPAMYPWRQYVERGGLMSFGVDLSDQYRRAAGYVDRILKGEKAGELPIQQPTKFELVINLKTASAIGLEIPAPVLAQASEVIE